MHYRGYVCTGEGVGGGAGPADLPLGLTFSLLLSGSLDNMADIGRNNGLVCAP